MRVKRSILIWVQVFLILAVVVTCTQSSEISDLKETLTVVQAYHGEHYDYPQSLEDAGIPEDRSGDVIYMKRKNDDFFLKTSSGSRISIDKQGNIRADTALAKSIQQVFRGLGLEPHLDGFASLALIAAIFLIFGLILYPENRPRDDR